MLRLMTNRRAGLSVVMIVLAAAALSAGQEPDQQAAPAAEVKSAGARRAIVREVREAERRIRRALHTEATLQFKDEPLQEAVRELTREAGVPLWIDEMALSEEGISLDEPVSADLERMRVETALELILSRLGLTWYVEHEVLKVTTETEEADRLSTKVYDVGELLRLAEQAERELSGADLSAEGVTTPVQFHNGGFCGGMGMVTSLPGTPSNWLTAVLWAMTSGEWEKIDGVGGTAELLNGALVLRQTQRVHGEVVGLIDLLTRAAKGELAHGSARVYPPGSPAEKTQRIYEALAKKGTARFEDETLLSALGSLGRQFQVPVIVHTLALAEEGISQDEPVTLNVQDVTLDSILELLLEPLGLAAIVRFGAMEITTETEAAEHLATVVYDISDLTRSGLETTNLLDALQSAVPGEWEEIDGVGGAVDVPFPGTLVIRQTQQVHEDVEVLLADLRRTLQRGERNGAAQAKKSRDPAQVTTRLYRIDLQAPIEQVTDAINMFVIGELEDSSDTLAITRVGSALMIRTTNRAHAAIRKCLQWLREAEADPYSAEPGGAYGPRDWGTEGDAGSGAAASGGGFFSAEP